MGYDINRFIKAYNLPIADVENISDGYHTFNDLYNQRLYLSAALCNCLPIDSCFKSKKHHDGSYPFDNKNWFIIGFKTKQGWYTYHYEMKYWNMFHCKELDRSPRYDGHTSNDVSRLLYLCK